MISGRLSADIGIAKVTSATLFQYMPQTLTTVILCIYSTSHRSIALTKSKWIMKQYWRVGMIRALLSLGLGMLVIGKFYSAFIPGLEALGLIGALILSVVLIMIFLGIGWWYDEKAKLWNESVQVGLERNPYQYVPDFRGLAIEYPVFYTFLETIRNLLNHLDMELKRADDLIRYLEDYFARTPNRDDIFSASDKSSEFLKENPFCDDEIEDTRPVSLRTRAKKRFQLEILRLNYVQSFTGLGQDVLVFGALYTTLLFPHVVISTQYGDLVPLDYLFTGILVISLPLFLGMVLAGWYYDRKLVLWSPDQIVQIERNPYSYVPEPRTYAMLLPFYYTIFRFLRNLFEERGMSADYIDRYAEYMHNYLQLHVARDADMEIARNLRASLGNLFEAQESSEQETK